MTTEPSLTEARRRLRADWRGLGRRIEAETGAIVGDRGWALLLLAFCAGLAAARRLSRTEDA